MNPENCSFGSDRASWRQGTASDQSSPDQSLGVTSSLAGDLQRTVDSISPMVLADGEARIIAANSAYASLIGLPPELLPGMSLWDITHPEDVIACQNLFSSLVCGDLPEYYVKKRYRRPDRSDVWVSVHAVPAGSDARNPRILGVLQDESAFVGPGTLPPTLLERMFNAAFQRSSFGMILFDSGATVIQVNDAFRQSLGFSSGELLGRALQDITHPDGHAEQVKALHEVFSLNQDTARYVTRFHRKAGDAIWAEVCLSAVRDPSGKIIFCSAQVLDISGRRNLEQQLQQAQKMEALGFLAGGIAHDFNNLLMIISAYSEMVFEALSDNRLKSQVAEVISASAKAATLTRQLLTFSRKQVVELQPMDLNRAVQESRRLLGRVLGANISIVLNLTGGPAIAVADPGQIDQVIINLAVNSRDAMPDGGTITIATDVVVIDDLYSRFASNLAPGEYVKLTFSDTGAGISPDVVDKIFEPFFTTKERGRGTGLGLSTVYGIVRQSNGHISVSSKPGMETTFVILLPKYKGSLGTGADLSTKSEGNGLRRGLVLLVEDEEAIRFSVKEFVSRMGYTVVDAASAEEAFVLASEHNQIDLLIADRMLPKISGEKLASALRIRQKNLKVLIMSGYADAPGEPGAASADFHFISKPFSYSRLVAAINGMLE